MTVSSTRLHAQGRGACLIKCTMNTKPSEYQLPTAFWVRNQNSTSEKPSDKQAVGGKQQQLPLWVSLTPAPLLEHFRCSKLSINRLTEFSSYFQVQSCPRSLQMTRFRRPGVSYDNKLVQQRDTLHNSRYLQAICSSQLMFRNYKRHHWPQCTGKQ